MSRVTKRIDLRHLAGGPLSLDKPGGCGLVQSSWVWEHPDPEYARLYRDRDIFTCERYAQDVAMGGPHEIVNARELGGLGEFRFRILHV
jgi:hypothetical protein